MEDFARDRVGNKYEMLVARVETNGSLRQRYLFADAKAKENTRDMEEISVAVRPCRFIGRVHYDLGSSRPRQDHVECNVSRETRLSAKPLSYFLAIRAEQYSAESPRKNRCFPEGAQCEMTDALNIDVGISRGSKGLTISVGVYRRLSVKYIVQRKLSIKRAELPNHPLLPAAVKHLFALLAQHFSLQLFARSTHLTITDYDRMEFIRAQIIINSARDEMAADQQLRLQTTRTHSYSRHRVQWVGGRCSSR